MSDVPAAPRAGYRRILQNRALLALWSGRTVSILGDTFFNLAVMWVVYAQSGSALQTSLVQVIWHLDRILFGPIAGVVADRLDRRRIMVATNALAALVAGVLAAVTFARGAAPVALIYVAVFCLNSLNTFLQPAQFSVLPEIVDRDLLASASGLFTTVRGMADFVGSALAGFVVAAAGAAWGIVADAASFVVAALAFALAPLPPRATLPAPASRDRRPGWWRDLRDGWRAMTEQPVVRALVFLSVLINVASFLGPLYPALVSQRLHGGAAAYGTIEAVGVVGGMVGGALSGALERRIGAGPLLAVGWACSGLCTIAMATSPWLPLTAACQAGGAFGLTAGGVASGAIRQVLVPPEYRGRVGGIAGSLAVVAIPLSALAGGWLADKVGVTVMFAAGGAWVLAIAALAWSNAHVRSARI